MSLLLLDSCTISHSQLYKSDTVNCHITNIPLLLSWSTVLYRPKSKKKKRDDHFHMQAVHPPRTLVGMFRISLWLFLDQQF